MLHSKKIIAMSLVAFCCVQMNAQVKSSGTISDSRGDPVMGAGVVELGTKNGTVSDLDGNFTIETKDGALLQVSCIGYETQQVKAGSGLTIVLKDDTQSLEEVVVIGYGTARKKDLTGAVLQVKPSEFMSESPSTVQDLLRNTAGLQVGMNNSAKGGGDLNIRGQRSVYTAGDHNSPLIILDGMQFYGELSEINPDNIAQIDILKDASSAAVYGAKAANGVVIITSKKGKQGAPTVSFSANLGVATRGDYQRMFTTDEYLQHKVDYFESMTYGYDASQASDPVSNGWVPYQKGQTNLGYYCNPDNLPEGVTKEQWRSYTSNGDQSDREIWLRRINLKGNALENAVAGKTVNWEDYVFRNGLRQNYNVNVGGATDKASYYFSAGYMDNQGVTIGDDYNTIRVALNTTMNVSSWLEIGAAVNFQKRNEGRKLNPSGMEQYCPYADDKDEEGNWLQYTLTSSEYTQRPQSPYFTSQYYDVDKGYEVYNSQFNAKVKLPFNITYQFNFSPRFQYYYNREFLSSDLPDSKASDRGVNRYSSKRFDWSLNNIITWNQVFADVHDLTITLVQEAEERKYWSDQTEARDILPTDALGYHYVAGATMAESKIDAEDTHETGDALMARVQYNYDSRYLLSASVRRDGYCAFGANYPYATFPAVAFAWVFSNEKFWEKPSSAMNYGKLRFSWGMNGNRSLKDPYVALANLTTGMYAQYYYNSAVQDMVYLRVDRLANPNLQWEKSTSYDAGLDFGFIGGRISGSLDVYLTETKDMIMDQRLPGFSGFSSITTNLGQVNNSGVELTLNTLNIDKPNFKWNTSLSFTYNKNRIKHLYGTYDENGVEEDDRTNEWFIGHAIDEIWDYKVEGIWKTSEREEAAKYGQEPGDPKIYNNPDNDIVNSDGTTTPYIDENDKVFLGNKTAPVRWTLRNDFTIFKNFTAGFTLYSYMGWKAYSNGVFNYDAFMNNDNDGGFLLYKMQNQPYKRYWTPENQYDDVARIGAVGTGGAASPHRYICRDFLRLDNLYIAYTFPKVLIGKIHLSNLKLYLNGRNLGTIHSNEWTYGDPENMSYSVRTFTFGIDVSF